MRAHVGRIVEFAERFLRSLDRVSGDKLQDRLTDLVACTSDMVVLVANEHVQREWRVVDAVREVPIAQAGACQVVSRELRAHARDRPRLDFSRAMRSARFCVIFFFTINPPRN